VKKHSEDRFGKNAPASVVVGIVEDRPKKILNQRHSWLAFKSASGKKGPSEVKVKRGRHTDVLGSFSKQVPVADFSVRAC
jgi:hypothetical protein